jgi:hypothetical protein
MDEETRVLAVHGRRRRAAYPNAEVTLSAHDESTADVPEGFRAIIGTLDAAGDILCAYLTFRNRHQACLNARIKRSTLQYAKEREENSNVELRQ